MLRTGRKDRSKLKIPTLAGSGGLHRPFTVLSAKSLPCGSGVLTNNFLCSVLDIDPCREELVIRFGESSKATNEIRPYSSCMFSHEKKVFVRLYKKRQKLQPHEWVETMTKQELTNLLQAGYSFRW